MRSFSPMSFMSNLVTSTRNVKIVQIGAAREFELLGTGEEVPPPAVLDRLKACCALTDALGPKVRLVLHLLIFRALG